MISEPEYYDYRLILPKGTFKDCRLPLYLAAGDVLMLEGEPSYRVMLCDPTAAFCERTKVFLIREQ